MEVSTAAPPWMTPVTGVAVERIPGHLRVLGIHKRLAVVVTCNAREYLIVRRSRMAIGAGRPSARWVAGSGTDREVWSMIP